MKEILANLSKEEHAKIMEAFNSCVPDYVEYAKGRFIGVNIDTATYPKLKITETKGKWSIGFILTAEEENKNE